MRQHGTNARYVWGPDETDTPGKGCRCSDCRAARAKAEGARKKRKAMESFHPERALWVDAKPARAHVRSLMASKRGATDGVGLKQIVKVSGVSHGSISRLVYGKRRPDGTRIPSKRIHRDTAAKLLAVTRADMAKGASVPAGPVWAMVDEIVAWYNSEVGTPAGNGYGRHPYGGKAWLGRYLTGNPAAQSLQLSRRSVSVEHARKVAKLHDRLAGEHESFRWRYCKCPSQRARDIAS